LNKEEMDMIYTIEELKQNQKLVCAKIAHTTHCCVMEKMNCRE